MKTPHSWRAISWIFTLSLFLSLAAVAALARPNVVLIVADDLGWADLACYGSDLHETPNLDRLSSQGMRFTEAYAASPVCTPTRASILTGKHPARLQMTIWREAALDRGNRQLLQPLCLDSLPLEEVTLAEIFQDAGYRTAHIGKWHLGRAESYPEAHGFQVNIGGTLWGAPQTFHYPYNGDAYFKDWRYVPDLEPGQEGDYLTDHLTTKALELLDGYAERQEPFFLNLWYHSVHTPIEGKPELVAHFEQKITDDSVQRNPHYAAMVKSLDENVGRVLTQLEEKDLAENTIVIFTSDNGGFVNTCKLHKGLQVANNMPLRSGKGSCWEGGVRVPLIIRAPGKATAQTCDEPVMSCDLFPTLLSLSGLGDQAASGKDGLDLAGLLDSPTTTHLDREALHFHYPHYYPTTTPVSAIRKGNWKLIEFYEPDRPLELYNLAEDLGETQNLAESNPEKRQELLRDLEAWKQEVGAALPEPNPEKR